MDILLEKRTKLIRKEDKSAFLNPVSNPVVVFKSRGKIEIRPNIIT
jgi:hypothetical protein